MLTYQVTFNIELVELVNGDPEVVVKVVEVLVESKTRTYPGRIGSERPARKKNKPTEKLNQRLTSGLSSVYERGEKRSLSQAADHWNSEFSSL